MLQQTKQITAFFPKGSAFLASAITIGSFFFLPFSGEYLQFIIIAVVVFPLAFLGFLIWIYGYKEPKPLFNFECRYCKGEGTKTKNGSKVTCQVCDGFGELLHPLEEKFLGVCNLCKCSGEIETLEDSSQCPDGPNCPNCHGYGINPELIGEIETKKAAIPKRSPKDVRFLNPLLKKS